MIVTPEDYELAHYGVKGMKWGVQRDEAVLRRMQGKRVRAVGGTEDERKEMTSQAKSDWKAYKKSTTGKERRADRRMADQSKLQYILDSAAKQPMSIISTRAPGDVVNTLTTGKEFLDYATRGGYMNVRATELTDYRFEE